MDNNFLAAPEEFISDQLERIRRSEIAIDFNQALDARLVNPQNAEKLAACKWIRFIRFSCDTAGMIEPCREAISMIRKHNRKQEIFVYLLVKEIEDAEIRLHAILEMKATPFAQPYRDFTANTEPTAEQRRFAAFTNVKGGRIALKMKFKDYKK